jgi:hypothetical protein
LQLKLLIIALIIVGMANVYLEIGGDENFIIVTPSQKECLKSWVDVEGEYDIYGPEVFDGHSIVSVGTKLESNFETELSGCFYDAVIENVSLSEVSTKVDFLKSQGVNQFYFYKPLKSESFNIYGLSQ